MRLLAIDFGTKKCGLAISDPLKIIAQPLKTIFYEDNNYDHLINEISQIINEYKPVEKIIIGITYNIDKSLSNTGKLIIKFKELLEQKLNLNIVLYDEKYTSKKSQDVLKQMNVKSVNKKKELEDSIAAQKILESYIEDNY